MSKKTIKLPISAGSYDVVIGIDPDKGKSGVAYLNVRERNFGLLSLDFVGSLNYLFSAKKDMEINGKKFIVVIEGGWLNRSVWHVKPTDTKALAAKKGYSVGQNHQTGIFLQEFCEANNIPYKVVKPLRKCWQGKDRKITHEELAAFTGMKQRRTNQEERDAALLAWVEANLPIKLSVKKSAKCV